VQAAAVLTANDIIDLFLKVAPYIVPTLTALVIATVGASIRTSGRLRRDLSTDATMLEKLPTRAWRALKDDMERRTLLLVGYSRYPSVTLYDVLGILGAILSIGGVVYTCVDLEKNGLANNPFPSLPSGIIFLMLMNSWLLGFHVPWSHRAAKRILYMKAHLGEDEAKADAQTLRVGLWFSSLAGGFATTGAAIALTYANLKISDVKPDQAWKISVIVAIPVLIILFLAAHRGPLANAISDVLDREEFERLVAVASDREAAKRARRQAKASARLAADADARPNP
jgi:hypothetical protein